MTLPERLVAHHRALARRRIPHAFGGAIALAYWTLDPRATSDIDVNVFLPAAGSARDGQIRLWWDETPVDLFFDSVPVHADAARHRLAVPFANTRIPVLGSTELAVFKAMFDRTRDWADIEAMLAAGTVDLEAVRETLRTMLDGDDVRFAKLSEAQRRAGSPSPVG